MAIKRANRSFPFVPLSNAWKKLSKQWKQWSSFLQVTAHFKPYLRKQRKRLIMAQLCVLGYVAIGLLEPWPIKLIFDNVFLDRPVPSILATVLGSIAHDRITLLNVFIGAVILIAVLRGLFYFYQQLLSSRSGQQVVANIRVDLYSHLQRLSFSFHDHRRTGDILSRLTTDIRILRDILISLPIKMTGEIFLMIGMLSVMFMMDYQLTLIALMSIPCLYFLMRKYRKPMKKAIKKQREREGHIATIAAEVLGAIKVVQGFRREESEVARFSVQNKSSLKTGLKAARLEAKLKWAAELAVATVTAVILAVAARHVISGALSPGDLLVFVAYLRAFNRPLRRISRITERTARATTSGERILDIMRIETEVRDLPGAIDMQHVLGEIRYEGVCFAYYNGKPVLLDANIHISPGEHLAITGPTGSGKSTLVSLLARFYDPTEGYICIDGRNICELTLDSLRSHISLVFQEPLLFATTISENIAYGKQDATLDEIKMAARLAGIHNIIEMLPDGYETVIGERGGTLSGGQRQCVAIARAIIKGAPIVILDEPTSGLDNQSTAMVIEALRKLMEKRTVLMISHQLETIQDVDRIIVLDKGRIVEHGSPSSLRAGNGLYQRLHGKQIGEHLS